LRTTQTAVKSSWVRPRRLKLSTGITEICGLVKPRTAAYKNLVGTDNEHVLMVSRREIGDRLGPQNDPSADATSRGQRAEGRG